MNRFRLLRYQRGLTQGEVADGAGVSRGTLWALENDDAKPISAPIASKLAAFYGVTVEQIVGLDPIDDATPAQDAA